MKSRSPHLQRLDLHLFTLGILCLLLGSAFPATAEEDASKRQRTVIKQLMYADVRQVAPILRLLDVKFEMMQEQSAIVLRGSDGGDLDTALKLLENLDAPTPDLELTVFILGSSKEGAQGKATPLPKDLQAVTEKLGQLFGYSRFHLLDTIILRAKSGSSAEVAGGLQGALASTDYSLSFRKARWVPQELSSDPETAKRGNTLRFDDLNFHLGSDNSAARARLHTDIEVREGQKAVLGKATPAGNANDALILVVEAHVIRPN